MPFCTCVPALMSSCNACVNMKMLTKFLWVSFSLSYFKLFNFTVLKLLKLKQLWTCQTTIFDC